ncbi:Phage protein [Sodalis praecaptivus]|uniref:Phage protein n=1 Tax=Sodalis praecaptivus TaxID=1239307 RepID=W0HZL1_9GAMM|nr:Phage protein [Sodalis praecaptivus]
MITYLTELIVGLLVIAALFVCAAQAMKRGEEE